jgi:hypothetical protein
MERFWTLQYLSQQHITELNATLFKEAAGGQWLVRADELPLPQERAYAPAVRTGQYGSLLLATTTLR